MIRPYIKNVCLASAEKARLEMGSHRQGTVFMTMEDFGKKFGMPHDQDFSEEGLDGAGKVHVEWYIETPRGIVDIHDYWWNPKDQLSIGAKDPRAALWVRGYLRNHGIKTSPSNGK